MLRECSVVMVMVMVVVMNGDGDDAWRTGDAQSSCSE
jgi:hypothetical protein